MWKMARKIAGATVVAAAGLSFVLASNSTALASPLADGCSGGTFCGWDGADLTGDKIITFSSFCSSHDVGLAGLGDRLTSYWNHTGRTVDLYNWTGQNWQLLSSIPDGRRGNLSGWANNKTDAVAVCTSP